MFTRKCYGWQRLLVSDAGDLNLTLEDNFRFGHSVKFAK